jgi:hypothetical protein
MVLLNGDLELLPGISVKVFPGAHGKYAGGDTSRVGQEGLLHFRSDSDFASSRRNVGDGVRSVSSANHREPQEVLCAWAIPERWLTVFTHDDKRRGDMWSAGSAALKGRSSTVAYAFPVLPQAFTL